MDIFCTNNPSLVKVMNTISWISDHDGIATDPDVKSAYAKKPRSVFLFSKEDWAKMRDDMTEFLADFFNTYIGSSVEENWTSLKLYILQSMATRIAVKTTCQNPPWMSGNPKRRIKKKHRMYAK